MAETNKEVPKTPAQVRKWREGVEYECILSKSPGYKKGMAYRSYKNEKGVICLRGSDGFEDPASMLVSGFIEARQKHLRSV